MSIDALPRLARLILGVLVMTAGSACADSLKDEIAPTGKLRVALYTGAPASIVRGATLDESKGVGFDLGKELARRIGVPF
jgi:polar amino acid transport system substrate-binding protein